MFLFTGEKINIKKKAASFSMHENTMTYFLFSVEGYIQHYTSGLITPLSPRDFVDMRQPSNEPAASIQSLTKPPLGWTCHAGHFYLPSPAQLPSSATGYIPRCCINVPQYEDSRDKRSWKTHVKIYFKNLTFNINY